jgi:hypothetical protein
MKIYNIVFLGDYLLTTLPSLVLARCVHNLQNKMAVAKYKHGEMHSFEELINILARWRDAIPGSDTVPTLLTLLAVPLRH